MISIKAGKTKIPYVSSCDDFEDTSRAFEIDRMQNSSSTKKSS